MLNNFPSERSIYEHWSELLREAETCRRLKQSQAEGQPRRGSVGVAWRARARICGIGAALGCQYESCRAVAPAIGRFLAPKRSHREEQRSPDESC